MNKCEQVPSLRVCHACQEWRIEFPVEARLESFEENVLFGLLEHRLLKSHTIP